METTVILPISEQEETKLTTSLEEIIKAVSEFDLENLKILSPEKPMLITGMEQVFSLFKQQGNSHFKTFPASCCCMVDEYTAVSFHTEIQLASAGLVYLKQFALVFIQDKETGGYKYFRFCAHIDWKRKYNIFID